MLPECLEALIARVEAGTPRRALRDVVSAELARRSGIGSQENVDAAVRVANLRDYSSGPQGDPECDAARALLAWLAT